MSEARAPFTEDVAVAYRRQFLIGPDPVRQDAGWGTHAVRRDLVASWHPDLEVHIAATPDRPTLILFGFWVDPEHPEHDSGQVLRRIHAGAQRLSDVTTATLPLGGRWALLYDGDDASTIFNDACGFRTVFYHRVASGQAACASQPELLRREFGLENLVDAELARLVASPEFALREGFLPGRRTTYSDCYQLPANHRLDLRSLATLRFFPVDPLSMRPATEVAEEASATLRNSIVGLASRSDLMLPVTAGWDSRILLAASRPVQDRILYYVHRMRLPARHPDLRIPARLMSRLGLPFHVNDTGEAPPAEFVRALQRNVTGARDLQKTRTIYFHYRNSQGLVNLNGNAAEIGRQRKRGWDHHDPGGLSDEAIAAIMGYPGQPFVSRAVGEWRRDVSRSRAAASVNLLDLLYWEQRMWKWGAQFPAEQDIAVEEFSPFNNRALLWALLAVHAEHRAVPDYPVFRMMIEILWPECLVEPINPTWVLGAVAEAARTVLSAEAKVRLKRILGR